MMERISFKRTTTLNPNTDIIFYVNILRQTGDFEIFESGSVVATGNIKILENYQTICESNERNGESIILTANDFYKEISLRNLYYKGGFRSVTSFDMKKRKTKIQWCNKFDCFLDTMIQVIVIFDLYPRDLFLPTFIGKLMIHPPSFLEQATKYKGKQILHTIGV